MNSLYFVTLCILVTCSLVATYPVHTDPHSSVCSNHLFELVSDVCKDYLEETNSTIDHRNVLFIDCCISICSMKRIVNNFCPRERLFIVTEKSKYKSPEPESTTITTTTKAPICIVPQDDKNCWYVNIQAWFESVKRSELNA